MLWYYIIVVNTSERRYKMLALAMIPGIILFYAVWKLDTVEKESPVLLLKLFVSGVLVMLADILLRTLGIRLLESTYNGTHILLYSFVDAFIFTALIEEGCRFMVLKLLTWKDKDFNYTFDAIVYAVTVSVGFLIAENIFYMIKYGSEVEPLKLILPVIAQVFISIFMGYFYGLAKLADIKGDKSDKKQHMCEAVLIPIVLHGFYEFCLSSRITLFIVIFIIYAVLMTVMAVVFFVKTQRNDTAIEWSETDMTDGEAFEKNVTSLLQGKEKGGE